MSSRLRDMVLRDQRIALALFGDSPPPPRKAAPYPEGEVIYRCNDRFVVRSGNTVTKYTTHPDGMGIHSQPSEALALQFVKDHTTIPVPEVFSSDWDRITMEHVEGQTLKEAWPSLESHQRSEILSQLKDYIAQMRSLKGLYLGRLDGQGVVVPSMMTRSGGPFPTFKEFHDWLVRPPKRIEEQSMYWHQITTQLGAEYPIVFTHGDISSRNVIVRDGRIVALLDWEWAGWYPEYWEYVFAMRGLDKVDWENLGSQLNKTSALSSTMYYGPSVEWLRRYGLSPFHDPFALVRMAFTWPRIPWDLGLGLRPDLHVMHDAVAITGEWPFLEVGNKPYECISLPVVGIYFGVARRLKIGVPCILED